MEEAYEFLLANPPLGLAVQRHGDELWLVTAPFQPASAGRGGRRSIDRILKRPRWMWTGWPYPPDLSRSIHTWFGVVDRGVVDRVRVERQAADGEEAALPVEQEVRVVRRSGRLEALSQTASTPMPTVEQLGNSSAGRRRGGERSPH